MVRRRPPATPKHREYATPACMNCFVCVSQSLTGHKNPVQCVQFNSAEDQIVAGSQSGSIRVWDMEAAKSECVCLCVRVCFVTHMHACKRVDACLHVELCGFNLGSI